MSVEENSHQVQNQFDVGFVFYSQFSSDPLYNLTLDWILILRFVPDSKHEYDELIGEDDDELDHPKAKDGVEGPGVLKPPRPHLLDPPHNPDGPGELGKPVKIENPSKDVKSKIDQGWQDNAFNQVSDF